MFRRHLTELRLITEKILQQRYEGHNVQCRWMEHQLDIAERKPVIIQELNLEAVEEYSDGSRLDWAAAAATSRRAEYLGMHATITDTDRKSVV